LHSLKLGNLLLCQLINLLEISLELGHFFLLLLDFFLLLRHILGGSLLELKEAVFIVLFGLLDFLFFLLLGNYVLFKSLDSRLLHRNLLGD